jgi:SAM-dependent methyltransferase
MAETDFTSNLDHWKRKPGEDYCQQQEMRKSKTDSSYQGQEDWLRHFLCQSSENGKKQIIRLLDFGCGYGRIANLASEFKTIDYFGFDVSEEMVAPLLKNPPRRFQEDITKRVRVAARLEEAYGKDEKFDIILTVSVLIHNPPDVAREIISALLDRLTPDGKVVLIENRHTALSALENFGHGGCWWHAFVRYFDGRADVEITDKFADRHAIYVARALAGASESRYVYRASPVSAPEQLDLQGVLHKGLDGAVLNAERLTAEWSANGRDQAALLGRVHDLEEKLAHQTSVLRSELAAVQARFSERQRVLEDLAAAVGRSEARLNESRGQSVEIPIEAHAENDQFEWNALQDTRYSHHCAKLRHVLHIFHKEWYGIRAAAGSLPGAKLAIPANIELRHASVLEIYNAILRNRYPRIVFHGVSKNAVKLIEFFSSRGLADIVYVVMHGAPAQWPHEPERRAAFAAIDLLRASKVRRLHFLKEGFRYPVDGLFKPMLFNLSPLFSGEARFRRKEELTDGAAFAPSWTDFRKNLYTNVLAASISEHVRAVWFYGAGVELPSPLSRKLVRQIYVTRDLTFELMAKASICLNVTLVDCHPMVNVEAQAIGCPCLRGDLHLDALEDHPYLTLTNVCDATSVGEIHAKIEKVLSVPKAEMEAMTLDYQAQSDEVARARYLDFLEL